MKPTPHQLAVIRGADRHLLVAAGAGSGKTATVINRLLYLLGVPVDGQVIDTPVEMDRLAAITFTIPAAAELEDKLRARLRAAGRNDLAWRTDTARIGTIHAFCGEVLQEFALHQDASPTLSVLQEGDTQALANECVRDALVNAVQAGHEGIISLLGRRTQGTVHDALLLLLAQGDRLHRLAAEDHHPADEAALLHVAVGASRLLDARLRANGAMDFDRMLTWTRDLLASDDYALRTLRRRIHTLVIDEFQDVDPVQWEIAQLLGDVGSGRTDTTRLLLVGDPKQSVYRFRGADVATWRRVERVFGEGHGLVVPLNANFRSTAPILDFVAATAGRMLDAKVDPARDRQEFEIDFAPLEVGNHDIQADPPNVELIMTPAGLEGGVETVRRLEAEAIARRVVELRTEHGLEWRHMALLMPTWSSATLYQDALRRHGVPTYLRRDADFYERREVMDLIVALRAARDPNDDLALFGFLRSPFVGLRDETLLQIARSGGQPYWPRLREVECGEPELLLRGVELLERAAALRDRVPHDQLLAELLERSGYWAHLALLGDERAQAVANLRKFLLIARERAEGSLGDLLRSIAAEREREDRVGDARLHGQKDDVVTLTTVHSSKGLEWPAVFWCDLVRGHDKRPPEVMVGRHGVALKDPDKEARTAEWNALVKEAADEGSAERTRLAYVATTRAERFLIVSPFPAEKPTNLSLVVGGLLGLDQGYRETVSYPRHDGGEWQATVRMADPAWIAEEEEAPEPVDIADEAVGDIELAPSPIVVAVGPILHSATEAHEYKSCPKRHWYRYVQGLTEPPTTITGTGEPTSNATVLGQIVHDVLERHVEGDDLDALVEAAIRQCDPGAPGAEMPEGAAYRAELRQVLESILADPAYREIADLPGARRELDFVYLTGPGEGWHGTLDLAASTAGGQVLLDVKTGHADAGSLEEKAAAYGTQQDVYTVAATEIGGTPVREFRFHFARPGLQARHPLSGEDLEQAGARLRAAAAGMEGGAPGLARDPATCTHCGFKTVGWCPGVSASG